MPDEGGLVDVHGLPTVSVHTDDGARLVAAVAGDAEAVDRPLAVLQHGFPDTPATWRHLAPLLVAEGYRVAMPWLRGYLPSRRGSRRTTIRTYADDLEAVRRQLRGDERAVLVGHDWGAAAAWTAAVAGPWRAVVGIAVPPEPALHGFLADLDQLWRSRYQLAARLPLEGWLLRERLRPLVDLWLAWSPGHVPDARDLVPLRRALSTREAVASALAPYRDQLVAGLLGRVPSAEGPVPTQPALVVHGSDDGCIDRRYAAAARRLLRDPRSEVRFVAGAGHFCHLERPDEVGEAVLSLLARS